LEGVEMQRRPAVKAEEYGEQQYLFVKCGE